MFEGSSEEKLTQALIILKELHEDIEQLSKEVRELREDKFHPLSTKTSLTDQRLSTVEKSVDELRGKVASVAVDADRVQKLERVVYSAVAVLIANLVGWLVALVVYVVRSSPK